MESIRRCLATNFAAARAYAGREGYARISGGQVENGIQLGTRVAVQQGRRAIKATSDAGHRNQCPGGAGILRVTHGRRNTERYRTT